MYTKKTVMLSYSCVHNKVTLIANHIAKMSPQHFIKKCVLKTLNKYKSNHSHFNLTPENYTTSVL